MKSARLCAFEVLDGVLRNNAYSNLALDSSLSGLDSRDRAFASQLVYGVIERRLTLDYLMNQHLKTRTKPKVKLLLYIGTYQIYFMDKVPDSSAVNETVSLCDEVGCGYYKGLVNAVLHSIIDSKTDINCIEDLEIRYSVPQSLINMWTKQYGLENTETILSSVNEHPPVFAVPNPLFVDSGELVYELYEDKIDCEEAFGIVKITSSFNLLKSRAFRNGLFHIEDLSSYTCAKRLDAGENMTVLDICAAPGGKTFTLAEMMNNTGAVYAFDLYEQRVKLIKDGAKRLGLNNVIAAVNDACVLNDSIPKADRILCDVPCSGFGVIRRKPEIRYKELDAVSDLPETQYKILETSSEYLKNGGRIIYSTCTLNKKENEKVVQRFLSEHNSFKLIEMQTIFPSKDGGDGFFFALMVKND